MGDFEKLRGKIKGPVFSVVLPFSSDESIDFKSLEKYLHTVYDAGGRIFYVMGYNSRFSELSWEEIKVLNTFVTRTVKQLDNNTVVIVADPLHCPTAVSIDFCKHAEAIGADVISLIFREKLYSKEQVYRHYKMCADASPIGILIHEMPFISGLGGHTVHWPLDLLDQIANIKNVIAIKEDTKDDDYTSQVVAQLQDRLSIVISGGGKRQWLRFADLGCRSWLNGIGVFEPRLATRFWEAYNGDDFQLMERIINHVEVPFFTKAVGQYGWHLAVKAALEVRGHMTRHERMPMLPLQDEEVKEIEEMLASMPIDEIIHDPKS